MLKQFYNEYLIEAGCDEAGRGCLAGPVFAAAVILPKDYKNELLNDSKKLSLKNRLILRKNILENSIDWAVATVDNVEIDDINILNASIFAMQKAVEKLNRVPQFLLIDGNRFKPFRDIPYETIIKGDGKYMSIASASILAKTFRDEYMLNLHIEYPHYGWDRNKGYPTKEHKAAIAKFGVTDYHRKSFRLNEQLKLNF